ncbi:hypothetical protein J4459_02175 [Candidatus Woesearchaeota archaeon]|nr:hypothetical protein [Candidatus Woesearchaeota archaeon]
MVINRFKEKLVGITGSLSGITSILGSWQVCHNICLGLITLLSLVGITLIGMPLFFLTKIAVPVWIFAVLMLILVFYFYIKRGCISRELILFNLGIILAGIPFKFLENFRIVFWIIGSILVFVSIISYIKGRKKK